MKSLSQDTADMYLPNSPWADVGLRGSEYRTTMTLRFEDHAALDGGEDGLDVIKQILTAAPKILSIHG